MQTTYRTGTCDQITRQLVGQVVKVAGWVSTIRDHGGITFIDVRDQFGLVQVVVTDDALLKGVTKECCISVEGTVRLRGEDNINTKIASGDIEVVVDKLDLLGPVIAPLPFEIEDSKNVREDVRLKYRYLDLRNPQVYNNIIFRSKVNKFLREEMQALGFNEITTPILSASSPEGARDFVVPSRLHPT